MTATPKIARSSPGEMMVHAVVAEAIARGFSEFDLGVGEARYKDESCEAVEPLFDSALGVSARGGSPPWRSWRLNAPSARSSNRRDSKPCTRGYGGRARTGD